MELIAKGWAGTLESGDVFVTVQPSDRLTINLESPVKDAYGPAILETVDQVLNELGIQKGIIDLADQGALDCTIRARLATALRRASEGGGGDE